MENYVKGIEKTEFFAGVWIVSVYHGMFRGSDHSLYIHVCMVYHQSTTIDQPIAIYYAVSVFHDRAVPDGNVYIV